MCVTLQQASVGMLLWLQWKVKSKPQCTSAFQASDCIVFANIPLAQSQRAWQMEDLKNWGNQLAIQKDLQINLYIVFSNYFMGGSVVTVMLRL